MPIDTEEKSIDAVIKNRGLEGKINAVGQSIYNELQTGATNAGGVIDDYLNSAATLIRLLRKSHLYGDDRHVPCLSDKLVGEIMEEKATLLLAHKLAQLKVVTEDVSSRV